MDPTLNMGDRVIVLKGEIFKQDYDIGEVIVFYPPNEIYERNIFNQYFDALQLWNISEDNNYQNSALIKRVVGLPGDSVKITVDGKVFVNGKQFIVDNVELSENYNFLEYSVPKNSVFVLGDNRANSQDSRYIGFIPIENIIGKAKYIIHPFPNFKRIND
jgi:signal peptidase I